jgi:hypothetical protein
MKLFSFEDETTQNVEALDSADTLESDVNEIVVEAEKEHPDEEIETINEAVEAGNDLEKVEDFVEAQEQKGGMDEDTAEAVRLAVEAIAHRVGYNPKRIYQLYATESFATSSSRKVNTQLAMEGIKEFLAELWEKVKKFVMTLWDKIKEFWDKHFDKVVKSIKKLEALNEELKNSNIKYEKEGFKVKIPENIARAFRTDTTTLDIRDVNAYVESAEKFISDVKNNITSGVKNSLDEMYNNIVNGTKKYKFDIKEAVNGNVEKDEAKKDLFVNIIRIVLNLHEFDGERKVLIDNIVGGRELVAIINSSGQPDITLEENNKPNKTTDMVIPSKESLIDLNKKLISMLNEYIYIKDNINKVREINKEFTNKLKDHYQKYFKEAIGDEYGKKEEIMVKMGVNAYANIFSLINVFFGKILKLAKTIATDTAQACIEYISFILKEFKVSNMPKPV